MIKKILSVILVLTLCAVSVSFSAEFKNPKANIAPKAKPQRRSAGESLPPLPLPATPLRRSERKRQPAPPALIGMINFSTMTNESKFPTTSIDIERLIQHANSKLQIKYRYVDLTLNKFSFDPKKLPLLYITGWTPMPKLSDTMIARLRRYIYDGGHWYYMLNVEEKNLEIQQEEKYHEFSHLEEWL